MALGTILITAVPMPSGVVSSKYRNGNNPNGTPSLAGAPTSLSFTAGVGGTYNFGQHGTDPDNDSPLTYTLSPNNVTGISMSNTGLLTVGTNATAATRTMTITISDPGLLSSNFTFSLTVVSVSSSVDFIIPVSASARTINGSTPTAYGTTTWASLSTSGKTLPTGGDIIQLAATTGTAHHGPIKFTNIVGTSLNSPIYIKGPQTGTDAAVIRRADPAAGGFTVEFASCRYFVLDGYLVGRTSNRSCGIRVMYAKNATNGNKEGVSSFVKFSATSNSAEYECDNFTVRYVEVDGGWDQNTSISLASNGIGIQTHDNGFLKSSHPGYWQENITLEYNWIRNTEGEGMYIGPNWYTGAVPCRNGTIRYNRTENTGWTGFQMKSWVGGANKIYGNYVIDAGIQGASGHWNSVQFINGNYEVYGNHFERCFNTGITFWHGSQADPGPSAADGYGVFEGIAYNNVVIDSGNFGINVGGSYTGGVRGKVYNNTIVRSTDNAVNFASTVYAGSFIRNNLAANCAAISPATSTANVTVTGNRSGTVAAQNFVNAAESNFRLTSTSPARDAGISGYPATDFDGINRPSGSSADQGAFEYVA